MCYTKKGGSGWLNPQYIPEETRAIGQEVRSEFANLFAQVDQLVEKVFQLGQKWEGISRELQKYEGIKDTLESHAVAAEAEK